MPRITKRAVDALRPHPGRDVFAWDSELRGFGVRVKPSGAKAFFIQYRNRVGRTRRMVIGKVGTLTPDQARTAARKALADAATGADPSADRKAARTALTVGQVCEWYLDQAASGRLLGKNGRSIKASTLAMDTSRIRAHVIPLLGEERVDDLGLEHFEHAQAHIAEGKTAKPRNGRGGNTTGGRGVAGRTMGMLHSIFEQAVRRNRITRNPLTKVRKMASGRRKRYLNPEELCALGSALRESESEGENLTGLAAIRLYLFTGFRRMEVLGLKRSWVLERDRAVSFPDTKTGEQLRPMGKRALAVEPQQVVLGEAEAADGCVGF
jgi:hypothetical protein